MSRGGRRALPHSQRRCLLVLGRELGNAARAEGRTVNAFFKSYFKSDIHLTTCSSLTWRLLSEGGRGGEWPRPKSELGQRDQKRMLRPQATAVLHGPNGGSCDGRGQRSDASAHRHMSRWPARRQSRAACKRRGAECSSGPANSPRWTRRGSFPSNCPGCSLPDPRLPWLRRRFPRFT